MKENAKEDADYLPLAPNLEQGGMTPREREARERQLQAQVKEAILRTQGNISMRFSK